jgi:steroid 5-alpha reductase family enzyme
MTPVTLVGIGWLLAVIVMAALWAWHLRLGNAGLADAAWPALAGGLAILYANLGDGAFARRSAIAWMMGAWGARLAVHRLYGGVLGQPEGPYLRALRRIWRAHANVRFFWLFQAYAVAAVVCSLPAVPASLDRAPDLSIVELAACGLWLVAFAGEATADRQRLRFTKNPANHGLACRAGLWRYSRHPDYWFRCLIWVSFVLFASASI